MKKILILGISSVILLFFLWIFIGMPVLVETPKCIEIGEGFSCQTVHYPKIILFLSYLKPIKIECKPTIFSDFTLCVSQ